jgi:hypothetical protein
VEVQGGGGGSGGGWRFRGGDEDVSIGGIFLLTFWVRPASSIALLSAAAPSYKYDFLNMYHYLFNLIIYLHNVYIYVCAC